MNIEKEIIKEHSKEQTTRLVNYVGNDPERFKELVTLFTCDEYRLVQRAAWPLSYVVEAHPELVKPYLKKLISNLKKTKLDAVKRNTVRFLQHIEIPDSLLGNVADICFQFLSDNKEAIAIRVFSMTVLFNITKKEPELARELKLILREKIDEESPAFQSRAKKILAAYKKMNL